MTTTHEAVVHSPTAALLELHGRVHDALREDLLLAIEALVSQRLPEARAIFERFEQRLEMHMRLEDEVVLPAYAAHAPNEGAGRVDHVEGDHTILLRHLEKTSAILDDLEPGAPALLREIVLSLDAPLRLLSTLEHHTLREQSHVYPIVAERFDDVTLGRVRDGLHTTLSLAHVA
jgi:hypothetical protein